MASGRSRKQVEKVEPTRRRSRPRRPGKRNYARWRAISLSLVYVVFAIHIIHWKIYGTTLAPLELNEVMYTLELGIVTAGFLFMCFLALGTLLFGRFFCSWACHIMVLQDLSAWLLRKLGIRRKPIRSRLLLWVPGMTALYMFVWPQVLRWWNSGSIPTFHFRSDAQGWASFATTNFWRNLPSAPIIVLTFLVCGFVIVYLLGSRTFCTYVCPYGAIFALADRFSPASIRLADTCEQCGTCTAACTSGIRVHEEIREHQRIVSPACLKDLDCVAACPQNALQYGFGTPSLFASRKSGGRFGRLAYDFALWEELLVAVVFVATLLTFRGLYSRIPFLLSLALGAILGYLAVTAVRFVTRKRVGLLSWRLKIDGRVTVAGRAFLVVIAFLAAFVGHSAVVRYHEYTGLKQAIAFDRGGDAQHRRELATSARSHLMTADRIGLIRNERVAQYLLGVSSYLGRTDEVIDYASRRLETAPYDSTARLRLGQALTRNGQAQLARQEFETIVRNWDAGAGVESDVGMAYHAIGELEAAAGRFPGAATALRRAVELAPGNAKAHAALASVVAELGDLEQAVSMLREAVRLDPGLGQAHYNLGTILAHLGRFTEAIPSYEKALETEAGDPELHNNLGFALMRTGALERSRQHFERAVSIAPGFAAAHFNLGIVAQAVGDPEQANAHFSKAGELDPRFAEMLESEL